MSKPEKNVQSRCVILHDSDDFQYVILKLVDNLVKQNTCAGNARNLTLFFSFGLEKSNLLFNHAVEKQSTQKFRNRKQNNQICVSLYPAQNVQCLDHYHHHRNTDFPRPFSIQVNWLVLQKSISLIRPPQTIVQSDWLRNNRHMSQSRKGTDAVTCQQVGGKVFCLGDLSEFSCKC